MKSGIFILIMAAAMFIVSPCRAGEELLKQVGVISLAGVEGRIDHMALSPDGRRLFVAALGNKSVEIVDTQKNVRASGIGGIREPQGVVYVVELKRLVVASGGDDNVRIFDEGLARVGTVPDLDDADNARYDADAKLVYVGYGGGALVIIDPGKCAKVGEIKLDGHPESFQLEKKGNRIFVNVPNADQIAVVDRAKREVITRWPVKEAGANFPMALDEEHHRLFVGCRRPSRVLVYDTNSGKLVTQTNCVDDTDDLFYDAAHERIYVSGGGGAITIIEQSDPDHYRWVGEIKTAGGARTSLFSPDQGMIYVAVPHCGRQEAEIRVYQIGG